MKNINIGTILNILAIILLIMLLKVGCNLDDQEPIIIRDTSYVYDTTWVDVEVPGKDIVKWKVKTVYEDVPIYITEEDCDSIVKEHYAKRYYSRELINDSNLTFRINDSLQKNSIYATGFSYKINRPVQIINNTTIKNEDNFRLSLGAKVVLIPDSNYVKLDVGPSVTVQKGKGLYSVDYGVYSKSVTGTVEYILFKK